MTERAEEPAPAHPLADLLDGLELVMTASGHKSSEGDGRTAADIRRELEEETRRGPE